MSRRLAYALAGASLLSCAQARPSDARAPWERAPLELPYCAGAASVVPDVPSECDVEVVQLVHARVKECYEQALARDGSVKGRVTVRFQVDTAGRVPLACVDATEIVDTAFADCAVEATRAVRMQTTGGCRASSTWLLDDGPRWVPPEPGEAPGITYPPRIDVKPPH